MQKPRTVHVHYDRCPSQMSQKKRFKWNFMKMGPSYSSQKWIFFYNFPKMALLYFSKNWIFYIVSSISLTRKIRVQVRVNWVENANSWRLKVLNLICVKKEKNTFLPIKASSNQNLSLNAFCIFCFSESDYSARIGYKKSKIIKRFSFFVLSRRRDWMSNCRF